MRTRHPFHLWDGLHAIPGALEQEVDWWHAVDGAAGAVAATPSVDLIGCGSSYFAAMAIAHVFRDTAGIPARAHDAFSYAAYPPPAAGRGALVAISHTGTTIDVLSAVEVQRAAGGPVLAITDDPDSPLAAAGDHVLIGPGGLEPALTKSRSYATTLQRGYALALAAARRLGRPAPALESTLDQVGELTATTLAATDADARRLAARCAKAARVVVVGGGPDEATANEGALKITEAAARHANAWQVEEAAHGTWASTEPGDPVIVLASRGRSTEHAHRIATGLHTLGAEVWLLANGEPPELPATVTALPDLDELLMPLVTVIPLYAFAYHLALARGRNPDTLRTEDPRYRTAREIMRRPRQPTP